MLTRLRLGSFLQVEMNRPPSILGQAVSGTNKNIAKYGKFEHLEERARL